jgi:hypothetical protein
MSYERNAGLSFVIDLLRKVRATPEIVERLWKGSGYGARRDRRPFRYQAFVPDRIGD